MTDDREVLGVIAPLRGQAAWGVRIGWGSFLTMEFGAPAAPGPTSARAADAGVRGEWHLWVKHAAWRLERDGRVTAASGDDRARLRSAEASLEGRVLREVEVAGPVPDTVVQFEGGYSLRVFPCASVGYEHWQLFLPDRRVLTAGPGTALALGPSSAPAQAEPERTDAALITFRIVGEDVLPDELTARTGLVPTVAETRGKSRERAPARVARRGVWALDSTLPREAHLDQHLGALLDALAPHREVILEARERWGAHVSFLCTLSSGEEYLNTGVDEQLVRRIAALGAGLYLSFSASAPPEGQ